MTLHFSPDFWLRRAGQASDLAPVGRPRFTAPEAPRVDPDATLDEPGPRVEDLLVPGGSRSVVFVPERYEANYAYPLLIWVGSGSPGRRELLSVMSRISPRNYLGVSIGLPALEVPLPPDALGELLQAIRGTVRALRRRHRVHTERIYPVGFGAAASVSLALVLERPDWFGGAVSLCGRFPQSKQPLFRYRELNRKPVLLAGGAKDERVPVAEVVRSGRLLHAAGLSVTTRVYDAGHDLTPRMLRDIDRWVMAGLGAVTA